MNKNDLNKLFLSYQKSLSLGDRDITHKYIEQLDKFPDNFAFMRDCFDDGHFTASTFVVNRDFSKILLMHHIKFDRWQQFGGHADGEINLLNVAKRELEEEAGIKKEEIYLYKNILELDIHDVEKIGNEPRHFHYDVRFLAVVDENITFKKADEEVHDIAWFDINMVLNSTDIKFQSSMKPALTKIIKIGNTLQK